MSILARIIITLAIVFGTGFCIGMLWGLYIEERNVENDRYKRFNKNKRIR